VVLVTPGAHTVSETAGTGTSLSNYDTVISGDCAPDGSVTLAAGDARSCTITNSRKPTLTVNKVCVPPADPGLFNLRIDGTTYAANAACGGATGQVVLSTGAHTVSETAGTGTSLSNYDTVISGDCAANGSITLAAGENKTCTITNTRKQTVTVNKVCLPPADPGLFNLRIDGTTYAANAPCGGTTGQVVVSIGAHTVSETAGTGTDLANYEVVIAGACAANGSVSLAAGEAKTCTITNKRLATVIIVKDTVPDAAQDFSFACAGLGVFLLDDDADGALSNTKQFTGVVSGSYQCTESNVNGYQVTASCSDPDNGSTVSLPSVTVDADAGETVTCTFTNTFVPGDSPVGGIAGLLEAPDGEVSAEAAQDGAGRTAAVFVFIAGALGGLAALAAWHRRPL
jgi:hypothetical protein